MYRNVRLLIFVKTIIPPYSNWSPRLTQANLPYVNEPDSYWGKPGLTGATSLRNSSLAKRWKFVKQLERVADDFPRPEFKFVWCYKLYDLFKLIENELRVVSHHSESWHIILALTKFVLCSTLHFFWEWSHRVRGTSLHHSAILVRQKSIWLNLAAYIKCLHRKIFIGFIN